MEEEKDLLVLVDEEGEEIEMEILDYFAHEDQEYALLTESHEGHDCENCDDGEHELFIMKVIIDGDMEEFQPVEEDKMEELIETVEALFSYDEDSDN
ncbi:MAG TPA: DUF1292 domain-containing protein [Clostridia bacterium]|nr:DUF1292 domain-containing protein [Clostridia bacterium]